MLIYRFKVTCAESDGFLREIEIQPNQTFLDFHHILVDSSELLHCDKASFYTADRMYKKDREVSLKPAKKQIRKYDEDIDQVVTEALALPLMKAEKLKHYIVDPHQKMIYEFMGKDYFSFHIELFKILQCDGTESYPRCIKRVGELPKKAEQPTPLPVKPSVPKVVIPKVPLPVIVDITKLDDIVENEEELAAIENELDGLLTEVESLTATDQDQSASSEFEFGFGQSEEDHEDEHLEHLDDFEDIENLDRRMSGYDRDQDDF